jgi:hypothetical protein
MKRLVEIKVLVEIESDTEVDQLTDAFEKTICSSPAGSDHRCLTRWFIVSTKLDVDAAAEWEDLLNE